jgi:hypothetical protein
MELESRVEVGLSTSIVALRAAGGEKKGSIESEVIKYGQESHATRTRE